MDERNDDRRYKTVASFHRLEIRKGKPLNVEIVQRFGARVTEENELILRELEKLPLGSIALPETASEQLDPPRAYLVHLLLPLGNPDDFLANLEDIYRQKWVPEFGARRARWIWHCQCIGRVIGFWFETAMSALERIRKLVG